LYLKILYFWRGTKRKHIDYRGATIREAVA
jgi:hypothetical protein